LTSLLQNYGAFAELTRHSECVESSKKDEIQTKIMLKYIFDTLLEYLENKNNPKTIHL